MCVPAKSLVCLMLALLSQDVFFQHKPESVTDSSEGRLGSRNKQSFSLLSLRALDGKKKCNLAVQCVSVPRSKV